MREKMDRKSFEHVHTIAVVKVCFPSKVLSIPRKQISYTEGPNTSFFLVRWKERRERKREGEGDIALGVCGPTEGLLVSNRKPGCGQGGLDVCCRCEVSTNVVVRPAVLEQDVLDIMEELQKISPHLEGLALPMTRSSSLEMRDCCGELYKGIVHVWHFERTLGQSLSKPSGTFLTSFVWEDFCSYRVFTLYECHFFFPSFSLYHPSTRLFFSYALKDMASRANSFGILVNMILMFS